MTKKYQKITKKCQFSAKSNKIVTKSREKLQFDDEMVTKRLQFDCRRVRVCKMRSGIVKNSQKNAVSGKKFVENADGLLLDKIRIL